MLKCCAIRVVASLICLWAAPAWAQPDESKQPPIDSGQPLAAKPVLPQARPDTDKPQLPPAQHVEVPLPRPAPPMLGTQAGTSNSDAATRPAATVGAECLAALRRVAIVERTASPDAAHSACTIPDPVRLLAVKGKFEVKFTGTPTLDCPMASALVDFVTNVAQPLARHHMDKTLTEISTGPGFSCRRRNNASTGKLSEHAFGNGVDITGFKFGEELGFTVAASSELQEPQADFQAALRKSACGWFTTILGPGSDGAHGTHLHFDLGRTADLKPGREPYRICN